MEVEQTLRELSTGEEGLTAAEAERRLREIGPNRLPEADRRPAWQRFLSQFNNVLVYVLLAGAVITALLGEWIDTWLILAVTLFNAVAGHLQEGKAEQALNEIRKMLSLQCPVIRDGRKEIIDAEMLVPGDLTELESGSRVPADLRLIRLQNLRIVESELTGESEPVSKQTAPVAREALPADRLCMAFSGTSVVQGRAVGVVVATGADTELGRISRMMSGVKEISTPLIRLINEFGKTLSLLILGLAAGLFLTGWFLHDLPLVELFMAMISIAVAAIPEGLPAVMTITLALGVRKMARERAIIRKLPAVETLGSVSVICTDKTGTLTRNEMTVRTVITAGGTWQVEGVGYAPEGRIRPVENGMPADRTGNPEDVQAGDPAYVPEGGEPAGPPDDPDGGRLRDPANDMELRELIRCFRLCNDARLEQEEGRWVVQGDPTDGALLTLAWKAELREAPGRRLDRIPFESELQYMATLDETEEGRLICLKGAPEKVLELCDRQLEKKGEAPLDRDYWQKIMDREAARGHRLIAAAVKQAGREKERLNPEDPSKDLLFLGVAALSDPPRSEAIEAISTCRKAGIRVVMITGDHLLTAGAIGEELGIGNGTKAVSGEELEEMDEEEFRRAALDHDIFARTTPEHKLRLVRALQQENRIVAMTGDGVNDAPALKRADVGIAMGIKGTEVTKEAADMVLADDNFATIARAVREGRTIYDNLRKSVLFLLPSNGTEALVITVAILAGMPLPLLPVQILWVNMVTSVTLGLALSFEPSDPGVMERRPRDPEESILDRLLLRRILLVSLFLSGITLWYFYRSTGAGGDLQTARTVAINILAIGDLFFLFNCRRLYGSVLRKEFFGNRIAFLVSGLYLLLQLLYTHAPFMNSWFQSAPLSLAQWGLPLAGGVALFLLVELEKRLFTGEKRAEVTPPSLH